MPSSERKRLLVRALLFALPLLVVVGWVEGRLRAIDNSFMMKRRELEARLPNLEVLVTGGSVALNGIDADALGVPAFNVGSGSQTLHYDVAIVSRYLDRLPRLRMVLIAHPFLYLHTELRNAPEAWRQHFYSVFWDVPVERPGDQLVTIQRHSYIALYTPRTAIEYALKGADAALTEGFHATGWLPVAVPSPAVRAAGLDPAWMKVRAEGHREQMRGESLTRNLAELEAFAAALRARGVLLVMTWVPGAPGYSERFGAGTLAEVRADIAGLEQRAGVRFFDYSRDPRFGPNDFYNADHLDENGARKWTAMLAAEVVQPLLKQQREAAQAGAGAGTAP
jgi:hypothetical protein